MPRYAGRVVDYLYFFLTCQQCLLTNPNLANEPEIAADILAYFLKDKEDLIRQDLAKSDFKAARRRVNGGSHGLQAFTTAFNTGLVSVGNAIA